MIHITEIVISIILTGQRSQTDPTDRPSRFNGKDKRYPCLWFFRIFRSMVYLKVSTSKQNVWDTF